MGRLGSCGFRHLELIGSGAIPKATHAAYVEIGDLGQAPPSAGVDSDPHFCGTSAPKKTHHIEATDLRLWGVSCVCLPEGETTIP